jgi:hypothetical protein
MTTKTEMTLENVCFKHDLREASEKAIEVGNKKYGANHKGEFECFYWVDKGKFFGHYDNFKRRKLIAPSDYLLLLSAPESQAHLLTEKDAQDCTICGNPFKGFNGTSRICCHEARQKLVSQPPVMEGKEESLLTQAYSRLINAYTEVIKNNSELGILATDSLSKVAELEKENRSLQSEVEQLKGALQELVDIQNGPPLEQHKNEWREIMDKCYSILSK